MGETNHNLCESCIKQAGSLDVPSFDVSDTGLCGSCGCVAEVFDLELISFYFGRGLSVEMIYRQLPRLRASHNGVIPVEPLTWAKIANNLKAVVSVKSDT